MDWRWLNLWEMNKFFLQVSTGARGIIRDGAFSTGGRLAGFF
jgi:hypothetical protein